MQDDGYAHKDAFEKAKELHDKMFANQDSAVVPIQVDLTAEPDFSMNENSGVGLQSS